MWTTRVRAGGNRGQLPCPHLAAIHGTLPGITAERQRLRSKLVGVCNGAEKVSHDLSSMASGAGKKRGLGAAAVDVPGSSCVRGQANVALRTCGMSHKEY